MKKIVRLVIAALILACTASTASLAIGAEAPIPPCLPGHCGG